MSVVASSSVFAGVVSVGFSGSRSLSPAASAALSALLPLVPPSGVRLAVGCAAGADKAARCWFGSSPSLLVFSVASGRFGSGRSAFARRSSRCVLSVAAGSRGLLVVVPVGACPAGVVPSRSFSGRGLSALLRLPLVVVVGCCCGFLLVLVLPCGLGCLGLLLVRLVLLAAGGLAFLLLVWFLFLFFRGFVGLAGGFRPWLLQVLLRSPSDKLPANP